MNNLKIVVTMAGNGSRFKEIGYTIPKHEIMANGKSLFKWSLLSLTDFFDCEFIFVVRKDNYNLENMERELEELDIKKYNILELDEITKGQAHTALAADSLISNNDSVVIFNIDTFIEQGVLKKSDLDSDCDGFLHSFEAEGDSWSFVKFDEEYNVSEVTEKVRISNYGTIGLYYFKKWSEYCLLLTEFADQIIEQYNETYIAPIYQYMIKQGKRVKTTVIPSEALHILGTPDDLKKFDSNYEENMM